MPLKHFTETFLIVVLAFVIALTGLFVATLPDLPAGALPWGALFLISVLYPLVLTPLFQYRRADIFFRVLHWFPAFMLLLWLAGQGIMFAWETRAAAATYEFGWALPAVLLGFFLIVFFCLKVIRRRKSRLFLLALILIPFTVLAVMSEQGPHYEEELASVLWAADFWELPESSSGLIARFVQKSSSQSSERNLNPSSDPGEESWRDRLRMQERRAERIAARKSAESGSRGSTVAMVESSSAGLIRSASSKPSRLPSSGFGWGLIVTTLAAGYSATLHMRARKRIS